MRRVVLLVLLGALAFAVGPTCTPRPEIRTPADGSVVSVPDGGTGVPVEATLGGGFGAGSAWRVTLLAGIDSPAPRIRDLTAGFVESAGRIVGEIPEAELVEGRSTLFVAIDADGDGGSENVVSASFSWEPAIPLDRADACDVTDPAVCLYPFPNDFFTRADPATDTGRRVDFVADAMPRNLSDTPVDPAEWNRNDGFSPGQAILLRVPGLELFEPSGDPAVPPSPAPGVAPEWDPGRSLAPDAAVVILDAETGERIPHWMELDSRLSDAEGRALIVRPARNYQSGRRYVVAVRGLRDAAGDPIPPSRAFRLLRDGIPTYAQEIEARRPHAEALFSILEAHGVPRDDLYLAWDFTVISKRNLSERMLAIRDDAFARLGDAAPAFTVAPVDPREGDDEVRFRVEGTFEVPVYLTNGGEPGGSDADTFLYCEDAAGDPRRCQGDELPQSSGEIFTARFRCTVPASAVAADGSAIPARPSLYGHGLLGSEGEAGASHVEDMAFEHNFVFCGTRWSGMSEDDIPTVLAILRDFGNFPTLADRLHQGLLNFLFLGRLMTHPDGLGSHPAFQADDGTPLIDGRTLFYDGNSQGAIAGGALAAFAQDYTRAVLGVPGMNYSTLLLRSVDFEFFLQLLRGAYGDPSLDPLLFGLAQMLWDRVETNGHANHLTRDPYPGTPAKKILLHVAFGDFQVSDTSAQVEARTIGAHVHRPAFDPAAYVDRNPAGEPRPFWQVEPYWDLPAIPASDPGPPVPGVTDPTYRFDGSAMVVWDSGNLQSPQKNMPPSGGNPELSECAERFGGDPHECPRRQIPARIQKSEFLRSGGAVLDVCAGDVCLADELP